MMDAAEAKACALRSTAAKPTVCPCFGDSEWMDARSRSLKSSISGADYSYCKVKGADRALYILRLDENRSDWTLAMYASPEAQTLAPQSGVNMRSNRVVG